MKLSIATIILTALLTTGCVSKVSPTAPQPPCDPEVEECESEGFATGSGS